tara:strand:- start:1897 stop:2187 length:291 start_codon:yes stop_codon:yes gene_type:complete
MGRFNTRTLNNATNNISSQLLIKNKNKMITIKLTEKNRLFFIGARTNTDPNVVREIYKKVFGGNIVFLKNNDLENWIIDAHKQKKEIDNRNKMKTI